METYGAYKIKKIFKTSLNYPCMDPPLCGPKKGSKSSLLNTAFNKEMYPLNLA